MNILYRYAFGADGTVVDVLTMTPETRRLGGPFACLACGRELVPRLGAIKRKHFAHKQDVHCSPETYLHRLAKLTFATAYRRALAAGSPYLVKRRVTGTCTHFQAAFGFTCERADKQSIDLTRYFDHVAVEASVAGYRADVLLSSSRSTHVILVEFAVAHPCSTEKLASSFRIIEVAIETEKDIEALTHGVLVEEQRLGPERRAACALHNFSGLAPQDLCKGRCDRHINVFHIHRSRKAVLATMPPRDVLKPHGPTVAHREVLGVAGNHDEQVALFRQKVREAHFTGVPIENCYVCKYHGAEVKGEAAIFCKLRRESCTSNAATQCGHYTPLLSLEACAAADAANAAYLEEHARRFSLRRWF